jgi:hypothetical protein
MKYPGLPPGNTFDRPAVAAPVAGPTERLDGEVAVVFRRKWGTTIWHWSPSCTSWPDEIECEERDTKPKVGEFCNECQVKAPSPATRRI